LNLSRDRPKYFEVENDVRFLGIVLDFEKKKYVGTVLIMHGFFSFFRKMTSEILIYVLIKASGQSKGWA